MTSFFSSQPTVPLQLSLTLHTILILGMLGLVFVVYRHSDSRKLSKLLRGVQWLQVILLYGWYMANHMSLAESLPFYHCRLAILALLLLPNRWLLKKYFALMGIFGPICALAYPVFDPFPLWHVTIFSYIIGHYALLGNALMYILNQKGEQLSYAYIVRTTALLNAFLLSVNLITDGNYGFLYNPPLVGNHGLLVNYMIVTIVFIALLSLINYLCDNYLIKEKSYLLHISKTAIKK